MEIARGNDAEALARLAFSERILGGDVNIAYWSEFAYAYHRLNRRAEAERFHRDLVALSANLTLGAGTRAMMSIAIGDNEKALEWLGVAAEKVRNHEIDEGFYALMNLRMNFTNDPLLKEPRFAEALSKIRGD